MSGEMWKEFQGYWISNQGRVKNKKGKILKQNLNNMGYFYLSLGANKKFLVHRLVALTFISNPNNEKVVNHLNGNHTDNRVENLEWCSQQDNVIHSYKNGFQPYKIVMLETENKIIEFPTIQMCADYLNISYKRVSGICCGSKKYKYKMWYKEKK